MSLSALNPIRAVKGATAREEEAVAAHEEETISMDTREEEPASM